MVPGVWAQNLWLQLIANDAGSINSATANKIHLAQAPFVPSNAMVVPDFSEANFPGYASVTLLVGPGVVGKNPVSNEQEIIIKEGAFPLIFMANAVPVAPQTIYGYYVTDFTMTKVLGCANLPTPVVISDLGHFVELPSPSFRFVLNGIK